MSAEAHRVHGLAGDDITPDWPPLQVAEVQRLLEGFPALRGPVTIRWRSPRPFSAAARVQTRAGEVFVKRHHRRVRTPVTLAEEHAFIEHLRARGLPIPALLADADGRTAVAQGDWTFEVHALAEGLDLYRDRWSWEPLDDLGQARSAGRMLAQLHCAAADYTAPQRHTFILVARDELLRAADLLTAIEAQWPLRPALAAFLRARDWRAELAPIAGRHRALQAHVQVQAPLWTHNDWHVSNLCWSGAGKDASISAVLDFGLAARTFALHDLATAIERNAIAWLQLPQHGDIGRPRTAQALIAGYGELAPLDDDALAVLADLLPIVHLDFALSEVEYYHGITRSTAHAEVAWHDFLLGHAAWFDSAQGKALLDAVRGGAA